ncbi:RES domain-containing protein [Mesorhizobium abyssinicae]|uniref:RES domain-containing protein n=1 Tax=Mesorhizobium abyssinicae TaxID=1209958 RepID=UPI0033998716
MKVAGVGSKETFHRCLAPKWAFLPTSSAGAAIDGGRFNRPGVEALYLSRSAQTALDE